ncbi:unnamed protein product [Blepharisma stoltei]|uniref:PPM-type phosphatase domain-containing protein n=1 Tax=Blepharisma stoltei TaxID=1481888 RepID=A0AAU9JN95_9CILI|nr:unnamed protein product [Blepharisma stoltei]
MLNRQRSMLRMDSLQIPCTSTRTVFKDPVQFLITSEVTSESNTLETTPKTSLPFVISSRSSLAETSKNRLRLKKQRTCIPRFSLLNDDIFLTPQNSDSNTDEHRLFRSKTQNFIGLQHPAITRTKKPCVVSYSSKSRIGETGGIYKKFNQDTCIAKPLFHQVNEFYLFTVCDGHGPSGHEISLQIKEIFPGLVESKLRHTKFSLNDLEDSLSKSIKKLTDQIAESKLPTENSGSTLNVVLVNGDKLVCANIGDSRAVLGSFNGQWTFKDLSRDHKPTEEDEKNRIIKSNGIVDHARSSFGKDIGPLRVWQTINNHGLAMSRSIGDTIAHEFGVSSEPEFSQRHLRENDKFLIVASDGIWDVISSEEAVKLVANALEKNKKDTCCDSLINEATRRWKQAYNKSVDDITVIVTFFGVQKLS